MFKTLQLILMLLCAIKAIATAMQRMDYQWALAWVMLAGFIGAIEEKTQKAFDNRD